MIKKVANYTKLLRRSRSSSSAMAGRWLTRLRGWRSATHEQINLADLAVMDSRSFYPHGNYESVKNNSEVPEHIRNEMLW
jgi:hypothetical protein